MSLNQFETDEQRAEALIDWLRSNFFFIILAIVIIIGSIVGWDYYKKHSKTQLSTQAMNYYVFEQSLESGKLDEKAIEVLTNDGKAKGFAELAILQKAAFEAENDNLTTTISDLQNQINNISDAVMKDLYRYRLALALYENKNYSESLNVLNQITTKSFAGLVKTLQGDIYVKEGRIDNAKVVYTEAFEILQSPVIQRKINQLSTDA